MICIDCDTEMTGKPVCLATRSAVRWRVPVIVVSVAVITATIIYFVHQVDLGITIERASNVFLVHNVFAYIAVILIALAWMFGYMDLRRAGYWIVGIGVIAGDRAEIEWFDPRKVDACGSGVEAYGEIDPAATVRTAVINKRAGGMGLISGRKAFQKPMAEGVELRWTYADLGLEPGAPVRVLNPLK